MKQLLLAILGAWLILCGCVSSREKKSARYYDEHEQEIREIRALYNRLYQHQPFNIGFSKRDFSYVGMDIITDTMRWALNNQFGLDDFKAAVEGFRYDTTALISLYQKLRKIECIWLGTDDMYFQGEAYPVVFLSFRSVRFGNPFLDRKYYTLLLLDPDRATPALDSVVLAAGFHPVRQKVYFKIMDRFR